MVKITLVDTNLNVVTAWAKEFKDDPDVKCIHGSILDQDTDAWVTPTNSAGNMSGGVDAAIKGTIHGIEEKLKSNIKTNGKLLVGNATIVPTNVSRPRYVIAAATMVNDSDDVSRTKNTALACAAAFQAIYAAANGVTHPIKSIAIPGLGAGTGKTPPEICARLMKAGHILFERKRYLSFESMKSELMELLEDMLLIPSTKPVKQVNEPVFPFAQKLVDKYPGKPNKGLTHVKYVSKDKTHKVSPKVTASQQQVLDALKAHKASPLGIGLECGCMYGDASKWAWSRLNSLRKKGLVERVSYGVYRAV